MFFKCIFALLFLLLTNPSLSLTLNNAETTCSDNYCVLLTGIDFASDSYVDIRTSSNGSVVSSVTGSDLTRGSSGGSDTLQFVVTSSSLRNSLNGDGLFLRVINPGVGWSNMKSVIRSQPPAQNPSLFSAETTCSDNYCVLLTGIDFASDSYVDIRTSSNGSVVSSVTGNDLTRGSSGGSDTLQFVVTSSSLRNSLNGDGLFLRVINPGVGWSSMLQVSREGQLALTGMLTVDDLVIAGRACNTDNPNEQLIVNIYSTYAFSDSCIIHNGENICLIASTITEVGNNVSDCNNMQTNKFEVDTPSIIKNGGMHRVYARVSTDFINSSPFYSYFNPGTSPFWDSGLNTKCIKRINGPGGTSGNNFEDLSECSFPVNNYYSLALQPEHTGDYGSPCENPKYPDSIVTISGENDGAMQFYWKMDKQNNLVAVMKSDITNFSHPCGDDVWNWYSFGLRNGQAGASFPRADKSGVHFTAKFNYSLNNATTRFYAICEAWWDGRGRSAVVNFVRTGLGDNVPNDPEVVVHYPNLEPESVSYLGEELGFDVHINGQTKDYFVNCGSIFKHAVDRGYLTQPINWANTQLSKIWIGQELHNFSGENAGTSKVELSNYRIVEIE